MNSLYNLCNVTLTSLGLEYVDQFDYNGSAEILILKTARYSYMPGATERFPSASLKSSQTSQSQNQG